MTATPTRKKPPRSGDLPGTLHSEACVLCEEEGFIPVVEIERKVLFPKAEAMITIAIFANGEILARLKDTDVTAEGASLEDAVASLKIEAEEEYYFLKEIKMGLAGHMKKQFNRIKMLFA